MHEKNIVAEIVEKRKKDIASRGYNFGFAIPAKRTRPVNQFMGEKGVILEIKRASPSKGDIAPDLNSPETAKKYRANGAAAISCLTEENYFKGSLKDLIEVCNAVPDVAVLRKDFLIDEEEIEIAYRCGADAVLLISGILTFEKMLSMVKKCASLGIRAFVEVRTNEDAEKVLRIKNAEDKKYADTIVCGVNSRNLRDFSIDLLVPAMLKEKLGGKVIFESGIETAEAAKKIGFMGFSGILLGEFAARNPSKAGEFVKAFKESDENLYGKNLIRLAEKISSKKAPLIKICGITRKEDLLLADSLGADFVGFIFGNGFKRSVFGPRFDAMKDELKNIKAFKVAVITQTDSAETRKAVELAEQGLIDFLQIHALSYEELPDSLKKIPHYFALTGKESIPDKDTAALVSFGEARFLQDCRAHAYAESSHLWLAGGVTPENAGELLEKFHPELIDVSSGIEDENQIGIKNPEKMKNLFKALR